MNIFKRSLSALLVLVMIVTAVPMGAIAVSAEATNGEYIYANVPTTGFIGSQDEIAMFYFSPEKSGYYTFSSSGSYDTYASVYDSDGVCIGDDDDSGLDNNFSIFQYFEAGAVYELRAGFYNAVGTINVNVSSFEIASVECDPITLIENTNGDWTTVWDPELDTEVEYYEYHFRNPSNFTVTMNDGTEVRVEDSRTFEYNGATYSFTFPMTQDYEDRWLPGKNIGKGIIGDVEFTYEVNIVDTPIVDIICDSPVTIMKESGGYTSDSYFNEDTMEWENTPEYYRYYPYPNTVIAVLADGSQVDIAGNDYTLYWEGFGYNCGVGTNQSYENQWSIGSYTATLSVANFIKDIEIEIVDTPVVSVDIPTVVVYENTNGHYAEITMWDEETQTETDISYYHYDTPWPPEYTVTLHDGSVFRNQDVWFEGSYHSLNIYPLEQSADAPLGIGVHKAYGSIAGYEFSYDFEIKAIPEITLDTPIVVDHSVEGVEVTYKFTPSVSGTYTFMSLDSVNDPMGYIYDDTGCQVSYDDDGGDNMNFFASCPMEAGREYTLVANGRNTECEPYTIVVEGSPIVSIEVDDVYVIENTHGYWSTCHTDDGGIIEYFYYSDINPTSFTVTMKDGSVIKVTDNSGFYWNGRWYGMSFYTYQGYEEQWSIGTYTVNGNIGGYEFTYNVVIEESPVVSFDYDRQFIIENSNGYLNRGEFYNDETGEWEYGEYFYYFVPELSNYIITLKDGSVYTNEGFEWRGEWYYPSHYSFEQSYFNPLGVGVHSTKAFVAGYWFDYEVEIIDTPVASVEAGSAVVLEHEFGHFRTEEYWNEQTGQYEISPEYFYYNPKMPSSFKVTMKDGTVYENESIYWNGQDWGFSFNEIKVNGENQGYLNQIGIGVYTITAYVLGYEFSYDYEIVSSPIASIEIEPVQLIENRNGYFNSNWYWDDETMSEQLSPEYFIYYNTAPQNVVITLKDGTVIDRNWFEWNGSEYYMSLSDGQNYLNRLLPGVNVRNFSIAGYHGTYNIEVSSVASNESFEYMKTASGVIITDCYLNTETIEIPATIEGAPVIGIAEFNQNYSNVKHFIIPDSVKTLGDYVLPSMRNLETIEIGAGVRNLYGEMFAYNRKLTTITVDENNENYKVVNGALYNKEVTSFIALPVAVVKELVVPKTCVDIDGIYYNIYSNIEISFEDGHAYYVTVDGVTYNKEMTRVEFCSKNFKGEYVMPDTVTEINALAFTEVDGLTSVVVSDQVTEIVYATFASCKNLKSVQLPEGLVSIEMYAFRDTPALEGIALPETLKEIGHGAFEISGIKSISIPDSCEYIAYKAFMNSELRTLDLGEGVVEIGSSAFESTPVQSVVVPDSTLIIGYNAFSGCRQLKSVVLGAGLESISSNTFANTGIESIVLPENIQYVGSRAFANSALKKVDFKNPAIQLGNYAFSNCPLDELILGDKMTEISEGAFAGTSIKVLDIPDSVTRIVYRAFSGCEDLSDISIPEGIVEIGGHTFDNTAWYNNHKDGVMYLDHAVYGWKGAMPAGTAISIKNGSTIIADYAFQHQVNLNAVTLPETLEIIGDYAFYGCDSLESIHIPASVYSMGEDVFLGCKSLKNITVDPENEYFYVEDGKLCSAKGFVIYDTTEEYFVENAWLRSTPYKYEYKVGEEFDPTGMNIILYYSNGYREFVTENFERYGIELQGFDSSSTGECRVNIVYNGEVCDWFWIDIVNENIPELPDAYWEIPVEVKPEYLDCTSLAFTVEFDPEQMEVVDVIADIAYAVEYDYSFVTITFTDVESIKEYYSEGDVLFVVITRTGGNIGSVDEVYYEIFDSYETSDEPSDVILGDVTGDNEVNAKDANIVKRIIAGATEVVEGSAMFMAADFNGDGTVNAKDANLLKRLIAGAL